MKINYPQAVLYLITICLFVAFSVIFDQPAILIFVFAFLAIIPLSIYLFFKSSDSYSFRIRPRSTYVEAPNEGVYIIEYSCSTRIRLFTGDIAFKCENRYYPSDIQSTLSIPLTKKEGVFSMPLSTTDIGLISVTLESVNLTDYLCLVKKTIPLSLIADIPVLPAESDSRDLPEITVREGTDEFVESDNSGNISSDVKEIREYRPGDRLQRVHWKLSAKLDDLFVKEMAHTSNLSIIILPELDRTKIHDTIATLLSCSKKMIADKTRFEIYVYNNNSCEIVSFTISDEETLLCAVTNLYCVPLYDSASAALDVYEATIGKSATVIHIYGKKIEIGENDVI